MSHEEKVAEIEEKAEEVKEAINEEKPDEAKQGLQELALAVAELRAELKAEIEEVRKAHGDHMENHATRLPWLEEIDKDGQAMEAAEREPIHSHRAYRKVL